MQQTKRALISVSDKTGIGEFAKRLANAGYQILSTGGTADAIRKEGIDVIDVSEVTKFPECFSGRVKTMHPLIMGGVLMRRGEDDVDAEKLGIEPIDIVVVNLYPFEEGVGSRASGVGVDDALIELIDIGGPTLLRSAAKNHKYVTVITDPSDYDRVAQEIEQSGDTSPELRSELATKVFLRTAAYDATIVEALSEGQSCGWMLTNGTELRYGENPHQQGTYYDVYQSRITDHGSRAWTVVQEEKQMSYLNLLDADGAWELVQDFSEPTVACIKHANPCGVSLHESIEEAFQLAYDADRLSAFGVVVALNRPCTKAIIEKIIDQKIFVEILIAPEYDSDAVELLKKRPKLRVIQMPARSEDANNETIRPALGGLLQQNRDTKIITKDDLTCVTDVKPTDAQLEDLLFAWHVCKHAKSNAIVFAKDSVTTGIGCGQTSRVDSTIIAARRAGERAKGSVMASDAFFPFPDSIEEASKNGIVAIIQPGGSIRDEEVIAKANALKIPMVTTGIRGFRH